MATSQGSARVIRITPDGPAKKEGLQVGDLLLEIDGVSVYDLPLHQIMRAIRGKVGTAVELVRLFFLALDRGCQKQVSPICSMCTIALHARMNKFCIVMQKIARGVERGTQRTKKVRIVRQQGIPTGRVKRPGSLINDSFFYTCVTILKKTVTGYFEEDRHRIYII
jgi:hypothetical protein